MHEVSQSTLKSILTFSDRCDPDIAAFQHAINHSGDELHPHSTYERKAKKFPTPLARSRASLNILSANPPSLLRVAKSTIAPSGEYHLALMFGPLIIESGIPEYARPRKVPNKI